MNHPSWPLFWQVTFVGSSTSRATPRMPSADTAGERTHLGSAQESQRASQEMETEIPGQHWANPAGAHLGLEQGVGHPPGTTGEAAQGKESTSLTSGPWQSPPHLQSKQSLHEMFFGNIIPKNHIYCSDSMDGRDTSELCSLGRIHF